jgi:hypothetical protein
MEILTETVLNFVGAPPTFGVASRHSRQVKHPRSGFMLCRKTSFTPHFLNKTTSVAEDNPHTYQPHYLIVLVMGIW